MKKNERCSWVEGGKGSMPDIVSDAQLVKSMVVLKVIVYLPYGPMGKSPFRGIYTLYNI